MMEEGEAPESSHSANPNTVFFSTRQPPVIKSFHIDDVQALENYYYYAHGAGLRFNLLDCIAHDQQCLLEFMSEKDRTLMMLSSSDPVAFLQRLRQHATTSASKESTKAFQSELARYHFSPFRDQHEVNEFIVEVTKRARMLLPDFAKRDAFQNDYHASDEKLDAVKYLVNKVAIFGCNSQYLKIRFGTIQKLNLKQFFSHLFAETQGVWNMLRTLLVLTGGDISKNFLELLSQFKTLNEFSSKAVHEDPKDHSHNPRDRNTFRSGRGG